MKIAAIVVDDWKLSIFKKQLDNGGYKYTQHKGIAADTITLKVETETVAALQPVIQAANNEAAKSNHAFNT